MGEDTFMYILTYYVRIYFITYFVFYICEREEEKMLDVGRYFLLQKLQSKVQVIFIFHFDAVGVEDDDEEVGKVCC